MDCPLCQLVDRIKNRNINKKNWSKKIGNVELFGTRYFCEKIFDKGFIDIVRYLDDEFLFVNSVRSNNKDRDIVVCMPLRHIDKKELTKSENAKLLSDFNARVIKFIESTYKSEDESVRVLENYGKLASVPMHAHKQIIYTKSKGLHLKYKPFKYKE